MSAIASVNLADYIRPIPDFPKPGILFRDITPLLASRRPFAEAIRRLADPSAGGVVWWPRPRPGDSFSPPPWPWNSMPAWCRSASRASSPARPCRYTYQLEYGCDTLQVHADAIRPGYRVLMVDDLLATGGTVEACCRMIEQAGGQWPAARS